MLRFALMRILYLIPVLLCVAFIVFALMDMAPGDIVATMITDEMTQEDIDALRAEFFLDRSLIYRFGRYIINLLRGDLGVSQISGLPIWDLFISRFPRTLQLALLSVAVGLVIAIPLGILAAKYAGTIWDNLITGFTLIGLSMPTFWQGLLFMLWFAHNMRWFPVGYDGTFRSFILPTLVVGTSLSASICRQTRSAILEVARQDYIRTARAKGVPELQITRRHKLRNAWIPIVTQIGMMVGFTIAGSAVVETVFTWPGVGRMLVEAIGARDVTTATGTVILTAIMFVLVLLIVDIVYGFVDPRIKVQFVGTRRSKRRSVRK